MGNLSANCKGCDSAKEEENQEIKAELRDIGEQDPITRSKVIFEKHLEKKGKILKNKKIEDILNSINPQATKISLPEDIIKTKKPDTFNESIIEFSNGEIYKGNWNNNNQDGYGIYIWPDKKKYEGNFKNNALHGYGHYSWPDGREYYGMFIMGKREGIGKYHWSDGRTFVGFWENGKQHGLGKYINLENQVKWGIWINGRRNRWISDEQIQALEEEDDEFIKQIEDFDENNFRINI